MTLRLEADAVVTVDSNDTVLAPGAIEIEDGLISWVGDPWPSRRLPARKSAGSAAFSCPGWSTATDMRP